CLPVLSRTAATGAAVLSKDSCGRGKIPPVSPLQARPRSMLGVQGFMAWPDSLASRRNVMQDISRTSALIFGACVFLGLTALGMLLGNAAIEYREYERTVTVKGLSEREYPADVVIWPIQFTEAG